jgi:protein-disulfide isomerase
VQIQRRCGKLKTCLPKSAVKSEIVTVMLPVKSCLITATAAAIVLAVSAFPSSRGDAPMPSLARFLADSVITSASAAEDDELMKAGPLGEKTLGDPDAPNVVIEYASMTCGHCRAFHEQTFDAFKEKYVDTGQVYFILREFPLDPLATSAIMLARCAHEERFFPIVDLLFEQQEKWAFVNNPAVALLNMVKQTGFTEDSFRACLTNQEVLDGVNWVKNRGANQFEVNATPTFFFNGEKKSGVLSLAEIDDILAN